MHRSKPILAALALGALLTACGGGDGQPGAAGQPVPQATTSSTPAPVQPAASTRHVEAKNAATLATALKSGKVHVWTAEDDPNKLLGRPGQYTSAASVVDKRVDCTDDVPGAACGATVEVFATVDDATTREKYIATAIKSIGSSEYHTIVGTALLRVTGELTPKQAAVFADRFKTATHQ
jgi:hypothetical protein